MWTEDREDLWTDEERQREEDLNLPMSGPGSHIIDRIEPSIVAPEGGYIFRNGKYYDSQGKAHEAPPSADSPLGQVNMLRDDYAPANGVWDATLAGRAKSGDKEAATELRMRGVVRKQYDELGFDGKLVGKEMGIEKPVIADTDSEIAAYFESLKDPGEKAFMAGKMQKLQKGEQDQQVELAKIETQRGLYQNSIASLEGVLSQADEKRQDVAAWASGDVTGQSRAGWYEDPIKHAAPEVLAKNSDYAELGRLHKQAYEANDLERADAIAKKMELVKMDFTPEQKTAIQRQYIDQLEKIDSVAANAQEELQKAKLELRGLNKTQQVVEMAAPMMKRAAFEEAKLKIEDSREKGKASEEKTKRVERNQERSEMKDEARARKEEIKNTEDDILDIIDTRFDKDYTTYTDGEKAKGLGAMTRLEWGIANSSKDPRLKELATEWKRMRKEHRSYLKSVTGEVGPENVEDQYRLLPVNAQQEIDDAIREIEAGLSNRGGAMTEEEKMKIRIMGIQRFKETQDTGN